MSLLVVKCFKGGLVTVECIKSNTKKWEVFLEHATVE